MSPLPGALLPSGNAPPAGASRHFDPDAATVARERTDVQSTATHPTDTTAAPAALTPPVVLGAYAAGDVLAQRYRLVDQIGHGGMGAVWRARSISLELDVALKLIRREAEVQHAAERLLKEARAAARVAHPSAVRVHDFGVTLAGDPFLVMELLQGSSLSQRLSELGTFPSTEAVQIVLPVAGALLAAHREGVVHRDVKPANIMLIEQGASIVPKLIDFGVAGVSAAIWATRLTTHGMMLGSPVYMAPEQIRGGTDPDERTDVWGLCTVLYELVSGVRPFAGPNSATVIFDVLNTRLRRPEQFQHEHELWNIVERGLAKAPQDRWPNMAAFGRALAEWALSRGVTFDAAGTSLGVHWLAQPSLRTLALLSK
ncbi:serine/threonine-protein kinase [Chondromyces crocatus]|uniref:serine/threonine-protein kinase n=1 Tax=Chondromyces crocatus TaxID=52 RepID=UPI001FDFB91F|nr:serine/threonine-protein kinase [Chondromyces crocatus]